MREFTAKKIVCFSHQLPTLSYDYASLNYDWPANILAGSLAPLGPRKWTSVARPLHVALAWLGTRLKQQMARYDPIYF